MIGRIKLCIIIFFILVSKSAFASVDFECNVDFSGKFVGNNYGTIDENTPFTGKFKVVGENAADRYPTYPDFSSFSIVRDKSVVSLDIGNHPLVTYELAQVQVGINKPNTEKASVDFEPVIVSSKPVIGGVVQNNAGSLIMKLGTATDSLITTDNFPVDIDLNELEFKRIQISHGRGAQMLIDDVSMECGNITQKNYCGDVPVSLNITAQDLPIVEYSDRTRFGCQYLSDQVPVPGPISLQVNCPVDYTLLYSGFNKTAREPAHLGSSTSETSEGQQFAELHLDITDKEADLNVDVYAYCKKMSN